MGGWGGGGSEVSVGVLFEESLCVWYLVAEFLRYLQGRLIGFLRSDTFFCSSSLDLDR